LLSRENLQLPIVSVKKKFLLFAIFWCPKFARKNQGPCSVWEVATMKTFFSIVSRSLKPIHLRFFAAVLADGGYFGWPGSPVAKPRAVLLESVISDPIQLL